MRGQVNQGTSGGSEIEGAINLYKIKAGNTINAGDFVKFVNKLQSSSITNLELMPRKIKLRNYYSACTLPDGNVFIACTSAHTPTNVLQAYIVSFNGYTVSVGAAISISTTVTDEVSCVCNSNGVVVVLYKDVSTAVQYYKIASLLYDKALVTAVLKTNTAVGYSTVMKYYGSLALLDSGNVAVSYVDNVGVKVRRYLVTGSSTLTENAELTLVTATDRSVVIGTLPRANPSSTSDYLVAFTGSPRMTDVVTGYTLEITSAGVTSKIKEGIMFTGLLFNYQVCMTSSTQGVLGTDENGALPVQGPRTYGMYAIQIAPDYTMSMGPKLSTYLNGNAGVYSMVAINSNSVLVQATSYYMYSPGLYYSYLGVVTINGTSLTQTSLSELYGGYTNGINNSVLTKFKDGSFAMIYLSDTGDNFDANTYYLGLSCIKVVDGKVLPADMFTTIEKATSYISGMSHVSKLPSDMYNADYTIRLRAVQLSSTRAIILITRSSGSPLSDAYVVDIKDTSFAVISTCPINYGTNDVYPCLFRVSGTCVGYAAGTEGSTMGINVQLIDISADGLTCTAGPFTFLEAPSFTGAVPRGIYNVSAVPTSTTAICVSCFVDPSVSTVNGKTPIYGLNVSRTTGKPVLTRLGSTYTLASDNTTMSDKLLFPVPSQSTRALAVYNSSPFAGGSDTVKTRVVTNSGSSVAMGTEYTMYTPTTGDAYVIDCMEYKNTSTTASNFIAFIEKGAEGYVAAFLMRNSTTSVYKIVEPVNIFAGRTANFIEACLVNSTTVVVFEGDYDGTAPLETFYKNIRYHILGLEGDVIKIVDSGRVISDDIDKFKSLFVMPQSLKKFNALFVKNPSSVDKRFIYTGLYASTTNGNGIARQPGIGGDIIEVVTPSSTV